MFREIIFRGMNVHGHSGHLGSSFVPARLDAIDRKILKELQDDGRITNVELASRVGISAPPCLRRVRGLEEAGYIKGYRALLDEKKLGYEVTVFAMVHLSSQAEADLVAFEKFVRAQPLVRECWMLSGEIDFVLKCVAPDLKTFQAFVEKLTRGPVLIMTVLRNGPMSMSRPLVQWFIFTVAVSVLTAYLAAATLPADAPYLAVFRVAGTAAFIAYAAAAWPESIWYHRPWSTTLKFTLDGLIYGLLTGGAFGWLWQQG